MIPRVKSICSLNSFKETEDSRIKYHLGKTSALSIVSQIENLKERKRGPLTSEQYPVHEKVCELCILLTVRYFFNLLNVIQKIAIAEVRGPQS